MMGPFGGPVRIHEGDDWDGSSRLSPEADMALVRDMLTAVADGEAGMLRMYRPQPTAAFSPRDTTLPNYSHAAETMRHMGFTPVERRAGGHLAVYDRNALVIDLVAHHPEPRDGVRERYERFAQALLSALQSLAIDARLGPVAGEYCPGAYSVSDAGRIKLAGLAQRIGRRGFHVGCVISVLPSESACTAVASAYRILGIPFLPETFGSVACAHREVAFDDLRTRLSTAIAGAVKE